MKQAWVLVVALYFLLLLDGVLCAWNTSIVRMCLLLPSLGQSIKGQGQAQGHTHGENTNQNLGIESAVSGSHSQLRSAEDHGRKGKPLTAVELYEVFTPSEWKSLRLDANTLFADHSVATRVGGKLGSSKSVSKNKESFWMRARSDQCIVRQLPEFCQVGRFRVSAGDTSTFSNVNSHSKLFRGEALYKKWENVPLNAAEELVFSLLDKQIYRLVFLGSHDDVLNRQGFDFMLCDLLRTSTRLQLAPEFTEVTQGSAAMGIGTGKRKQTGAGRLRRALAHDNVVLISFIVHWPEENTVRGNSNTGNEEMEPTVPGYGRHENEVFQLMYLSSREPYQHYLHTPAPVGFAADPATSSKMNSSSNSTPIQNNASSSCLSPKVLSRASFSYMYDRLDSIDKWWPGRRSSSYEGSYTQNLTLGHSPGGLHYVYRKTVPGDKVTPTNPTSINDKELFVINSNTWSHEQVQAVWACDISVVSHVLRPRMKALIKFLKDYPNKYGIFRESIPLAMENYGDNTTKKENEEIGGVGVGTVGSSSSFISSTSSTDIFMRILHQLELNTWYRYLGYLRLHRYASGFPTLVDVVPPSVSMLEGTSPIARYTDGSNVDAVQQSLQSVQRVRGILYSPFVLSVFWHGIGHELAVLLQRRLRPDPWMDAW